MTTPEDFLAMAGLTKPPRFLTEAEISKRERAMAQGDRRRRIEPGTAINDALAEGDMERIVAGTCRDTMALRSVLRWVESWRPRKASEPKAERSYPPWLWLCGPTGIGKTVAAAAAISEVGGSYVRFPALLEEGRVFARKNSARELDEARNMFRARYATHGLLVLDEVGIETDRERAEAAAALHEVVEMRQKAAHKTLVITNQEASVIVQRFNPTAKHYDPRTWSRLERMLVGGVPQEMAGADLRRVR